MPSDELADCYRGNHIRGDMQWCKYCGEPMMDKTKPMPSDELREAKIAVIRRGVIHPTYDSSDAKLAVEHYGAVEYLLGELDRLAAHPDIPATEQSGKICDGQLILNHERTFVACNRCPYRRPLMGHYRVTASGDSARLAEAVARIIKEWNNWYDGPEVAVPGPFIEAIMALREVSESNIRGDEQSRWPWRGKVAAPAPAVAEAQQECGKYFGCRTKHVRFMDGSWHSHPCPQDAGHEGPCGPPELTQQQIDHLVQNGNREPNEPPAALDALRRNLVQLLKCFPLQTKRAAMGLPSDQDEDYTYGLIADAIIAAAKQGR